jgi:hypothetical protein
MIQGGAVMENQTIRLYCLRDDGRKELAKLELVGLNQAHEMAELVLRMGNGLYSEVEICTESGYSETIRRHAGVGATGSKVWSIRTQ